MTTYLGTDGINIFLISIMIIKREATGMKARNAVRQILQNRSCRIFMIQWIMFSEKVSVRKARPLKKQETGYLDYCSERERSKTEN